VLKGTLDKSVAAIGLVFSFTLALMLRFWIRQKNQQPIATRVTKLYFLGPWG
jgi:hypothetical protein